MIMRKICVTLQVIICNKIAYNIIGGVNQMTQFIGIDPKTGYKLFVDEKSTLRLELPKCPCCGGEEVLSHKTMFGGKHVCSTCGDKWAAYLSARSRLSIRSSNRVVLNQLDRINYWLGVKEEGGHAPATIEQDRDNIKQYLAFYGISENIKAAPKVAMQTRVCSYCGRQTKAPQGISRPRCPECESRYKRYRYLQTHIGVLNADECEEFNGILTEYVDLMRRGYWAPDVPKYRKKIKERIDEIV